MMSDFTEMANEHMQEKEVSKYDNHRRVDWHPIDNPWIDQRVLSEIERLNLYQRMHNGED
jgi:hypothetical protein